MTITELRAAVRTALTDHRVDLREARALVSATGTTLSGAEAKVLGELSDRLVGPSPGSATAPYATAGAKDHFDALYRANDLPYGANRMPVATMLRNAFTNVPLGAPLAKAPSTSALVPVVIRDDRAVDGFRQTAYVSPTSSNVYLYVDGGGRANPEPKWYGPFDRTKVTATPSTTVVSMRPGMSGNRSVQITRTLNQVLDATAAGRPGAAQFSLETLPPGYKLLNAGVRATRGSGNQVRALTVLLVDDGRPLDALDRYFIRADGGGQPTRYAGPLTLPPFSLVDPLADGKLTNPARAKNLYYRLSFDERFSWRTGAPPSTVRLARGYTVANDATPYFVIPKKADGTLDDPDKATEVYFRHLGTGKWSGPHAL